MGRHTLAGNPPITVTLRRSGRARRLSLRVSRLDGRVSLTLPTWTPEREGIAFLQSKEGWLREQLGGLQPSVQVQVGGSVMFAGQEHRVLVQDRPGVRLTESGIAVAATRPAGPQLRAFFRNAARDALVAASDRHAAKLGRPYARITLRDTRSRWGSCTTDGALMYSWRLIMAPPEVLDYVAAHEVAHLAEMNHSPAFWRIVEGLCSDHGRHRAWLRQNGDRLHRYTFGN
jgi:predicted metal-dependent hydrolase